MDKHTPLTKLTENKKKAKSPPEERQYSKKKIKILRNPRLP
jgi:hypothetical protein